MNTQLIKAILFDLGNVIVRFDAEKVEKEFGGYGKIKEGEFVDYITDSDNTNRYMEGRLTSSQFYNKTRRLFKMDIGFNEFYRVWNSMFYSYPEMEDIIKAIRKKYPDIKLVLISNTNESHYEFIREQYKILDLMNAHVVSHEVGKQKPHMDIFNEALRLAESIPKDTFYTDDRLDLIEAARVMGLRAFQFVGHDQLRKQLTKYNIHI
ncbi:MAG: HAD family phosphatase [Candidatus Omnitrophota bacterium]